MAAPRSAPAPTVDEARSYSSPPVVPSAWTPTRPGEVDGFQPSGSRLGYQGPDQGFALKIANGMRSRLHLAPGEDADDVVRGCLAIALRRASLFSRAPVVHDLTLAFTIWGVLTADSPADQVAERRHLFEGVAHHHHYAELRHLADMVPESTLRLTPQQVAAAPRVDWRRLVGCDDSAAA